LCDLLKYFTHLGALSLTPSNAAFRAALTRFSVDF
jgi:hypothetical protein